MGPTVFNGSDRACFEQKTEPIVRVSGLSKRFRRESGDYVAAVDSISFEVRSGEFVVLLGPSGCGKTTLLRSIAGLETPDEGQIELHGRTVFDSEKGVNLPPEARRISMVFQSYALWPHMTAFDNVAYPLRTNRSLAKDKRAVAERVDRALTLVGIPTLGDQYPSQMSGGQQQRVALARALVLGTDLILFDEPLSNVDAKVREQLRLELLSMQEALGFAALFVTHDQAEAMVLADRIAVLEHGRIAQLASSPEVYRRPATRYVANFIGTTNELAGEVTQILAGEGRCIVETELGTWVGTPGTDLRVGDRVAVVWRPEAIRMGADATENVFEGEVATVLFLGSHLEVVFQSGGISLRAWLVASETDLTAGDRTQLGVSSRHVRVLPEDERRDS